MELKTYQARSMSEALAKVKADLGHRAMILHTRTIKRGGVLGIGARNWVEITATADSRRPAAPAAAKAGAELRFDPRPASPPRPPSSTAQSGSVGCTEKSDVVAGDIEDGLRREVDEIRAMVKDLLDRSSESTISGRPAELIEQYTHLISQDVSEELAVELLDRVAVRVKDTAAYWDAAGRLVAGLPPSADRVRQELVQCVSEMLPPAEPLSLAAQDRPTIVAVVGPTGVGKTTTVAKLAAQMKLREGRKVGLITLDTYRIAAVEQLKTYAQIMQIPIAPVVSPEEMAPAIRQMAALDLILIDTAGRSPKDEPRIAELAEFIKTANPDEVHLVLSSTSREAALREAIEKFSAVGARRLIFTKLDEAVGFGVILNVLKTVEMRLSYLTTGQSVPDDIEVGSGRRVAELILGFERGSMREQPSATNFVRPVSQLRGEAQ